MCGFDSNNICSWTQSLADNFNWTLNSGHTPSSGTGPIGDHSGMGSYLYLDSSYPRKPCDKAVLVSPVLPPTSTTYYCFNFWYHMYGPNIGDLNIRIFIEGTVANGVLGDIAIDDLSMDANACPGTKLCDFEMDTCGYTQDKTDNFDWLRHSQGTTSFATGPSGDHTEGTAGGYYMYIEASAPRLPHDKARMISPAYQQTSAECLQFYYHMHGNTMGSLNVYVSVNGNRGSPVWTQSGEQGNKWILGEVTIKASTKYQVVFEGVRGSGYYNDIGLDDIYIDNAACPTPGSCDFETGLCAFTNIQGDDFDWTRAKGATQSYYTGPSTDHTTNSVNGYYMFIESSSPMVTGEKAWLLSEKLPATTGSCLTFYYNMNGAGMGTLSVYQLGTLSNKTIFSVTGNKGNVWLQDRVTLTSNTPYRFMFEGKKGVNYTSDMAIDDVSLLVGNCASQTTPGPSTVPPVSTTAPLYSCDFEHGSCGWSQSHTDSFDWTLHQGSTGSVGTGPSFDHTTMSTQGHYIYIEASGQRPNASAAFVSPTFTTTGPTCVTFWYHMYGYHVNRLGVYLQSTGKFQQQWTKIGTQGNQWKYAEVEIGAVINTQVVFQALRGIGYQGDIALDDLKILNGACPAPSYCDFEDIKLCGYTLTSTDWSRTQGTGPVKDHTYGTSQGHYMYISPNPATMKVTKAQMYSKQYPPPPNGQCVSFWYIMSGRNGGTFNLYAKQESDKTLAKPKWSLYGDQGNRWKLARIDVTAQEKYQLVFEAIQGSGTGTFIALDDISVSSASCASLASCDFENSFCSWMQSKSDDFDWTRRRGSTPSTYTGPTTDHTLGSYYAFIESSSPNKAGDIATLQSQIIPMNSAVPNYCLSFWYDMNGASIGSLNVSLQYPKSQPQMIWTLSGAQGNKWQQAFARIDNPYDNFELYISASVGSSYTGDIAIDYLNLISDSCDSAQKGANGTFYCQDTANTSVPLSNVCNFIRDCPNGNDELQCGDCGFEGTYCTWTDDSQGSFQWTLGQNETRTSNTGPSFDHTYNSPKGTYLYVDASYGTRSSVAELVGPKLGASSSTCQMSFWYFMYGAGIGTLNVAARADNRDTVLWERHGNQAKKWLNGIIDIGRISTSFNIVIQGSRTFSVLGDIAIDDVQFINCNFPPVQPTCSGSQFRCKRGACVPNSERCDFSDDCGDAGYPARCDFETSLCSWTQDKGDNFDWTRSNGQTSSVETGPSRDHTRGTSLGYYLFIETSSPRKQGDRARLVSPTFNPTMSRKRAATTCTDP
ncbi:MAM and LDL-receptor class A domain-containing protein 1-like [Haliotis cracherodii]|uniref:MAM and LDL-receptor class A domain-containing protein 1-like n=1 Tax=Haliotis cracherodii TaxID=6455 RepID=UPI0039EC87D2